MKARIIKTEQNDYSQRVPKKVLSDPEFARTCYDMLVAEKPNEDNASFETWYDNVRTIAFGQRIIDIDDFYQTMNRVKKGGV